MYKFYLQPDWEKVKDCAEAQEFTGWERDIEEGICTEEDAEERMKELYEILIKY